MIQNIIRIGVVAVWALLAAGAAAQPGGGKQYWLARVQTADQRSPELVIVFTLASDPTNPPLPSVQEERWVGTMDIPLGNGPGPGAVAVPLSAVTVTAKRISIVQVEPSGARNIFDAEVKDGTQAAEGHVIIGEVQRFPMTMRRIDEAEARTLIIPRPQQPRPPLPYRQEEVRVPVPEGSLVGSLTLPAGAGPHPCVVLLSDGGAQPRWHDDGLHQPFAVIADRLARLGLASLAVDDRETGATGGSFAEVTVERLEEDGVAMLKMLGSRTDIEQTRVGVLGLGQGAQVGAMLAARSPGTDGIEVRALVMIGAQGMTGLEAALLRDQRSYEASGEDAEFVSRRMALRRELLTMAAQGKKEAEITEATVADLQFVMDSNRADTIGITKSNIEDYAASQVSNLMRPSTVSWLNSDPLPAYRSVRCPVLALAGERDMVVTTRDNAPRVEAALNESPSKDKTCRVLPGVNHVLQPAISGAPEEVIQISTTIDPAALDLIGVWLRTHLGGPEKPPDR